MENEEARVSNYINILASDTNNILGTLFTPYEKDIMAKYVAAYIRKDLANIILDQEEQNVLNAFK